MSRATRTAAGLVTAALLTLAATAGGAETLRFLDLYEGSGPLGLKFSEAATRLTGRPVVMRGFLAPPLKAEATFFVLSSRPVSVCPFCQSDSDWPIDIVVVYPDTGASVFRSGSAQVEVSGRLELGSQRDPDTGFVSQVRLTHATVRFI